MITLANIEQATEQEIINQVSENLVRQNEKCVDENGLCVFRGKNNMKCAAGHLISDKEFDNLIQIDGISNNSGWLALICKGVAPKKHGRLIICLQQIHDTSPKERWGENFKRMKEFYPFLPDEEKKLRDNLNYSYRQKIPIKLIWE